MACLRRGLPRVDPMRPTAILIILLTSLLAGCSGGAKETVQDDPAIVIDEDENIQVAPELGAVRGMVRSEQGARVPDARVQLAGTTMFDTTGPDGRFLFVNVTPPEVTLRVEAQGFRVWEAPVPVTAQKVSAVNVTLLSDLALDPDLRPHQHDMWRGQTSVTIVDAEYPFTKFRPTDPASAASAATMFTAANAERRNTDGYDVPIPIPDVVPDEDMPNEYPALVYPGTQRIEVTLDWDIPEDSTLTELALVYHNATTNKKQYLDLQGAGETWVIELEDPFSTDRGHQEFSMWGFFLNSLNEISSVGGSYRGPGHYMGNFHAKIEIFRGPEVPLEPAHPDFWGDNTSMVIRPGDSGHTMNPAITVLHRNHADLGAFDIDVRGAIVPPGTTRMRLDFSWTHSDGDGTAPTIPWVLTWRSADQNPLVTTLDMYHRAAPIEGSPPTQHLVYEFDVEPQQADAYYQQDSRWGFLISTEGMEDDTSYFQQHRIREPNGPRFALEVTVFKE